MSTSHADSHDLDKLTRWCGELSSSGNSRFSVHALFLASELDRMAHDAFRRFRSSFEARGAPFSNLVIFGQHGVSSTVQGLLSGFGLQAGAIPVLLLFHGLSSTTVYSLPLAAGGDGHDAPWMAILSKVEEITDGCDGVPDLGEIPELECRQVADGTVVELAGRVLESLK